MIINKTDDYIFIQADENKVLKLLDGAICKSCYCPLWIGINGIAEIDEMEITETN